MSEWTPKDVGMVLGGVILILSPFAWKVGMMALRDYRKEKAWKDHVNNKTTMQDCFADLRHEFTERMERMERKLDSALHNQDEKVDEVREDVAVLKSKVKDLRDRGKAS